MVEISALLATRNRAHLLPRVLDALRRQTLAPSRFEVIAVDDGSADDTPTVLQRYAGTMPLRIFRQRHSGIAEARNLGVFAARSPIVVFLDDDDVAAPDLIAVHLAAHAARPDNGMAVLGHGRLADDVLRLPVMRHVAEVGGQLFSYRGLRPRKFLGYREFRGGRSSCKRELLLRNGVFNPALGCGCEAIECGWRLARHGLKVIYEPAAVSTMIRAISFDDFCTRSYWQGRSRFHFAALHPHPEIRKYCEIDISLAAWRENWRDYAAILRRARKLDRLANIRLECGFALPAAFQKHLDAAYHQAFFLSRAKGIADALSLAPADTGRSRSGQPRHGLPGDLSGLLTPQDTGIGLQDFQERAAV